MIDVNDVNAKKISPTLAIAADIQLKYFSANPTNLTLDEVKEEAFVICKDVPFPDLVMIFTLIEDWYSKLQEVEAA